MNAYAPYYSCLRCFRLRHECCCRRDEFATRDIARARKRRAQVREALLDRLQARLEALS
jgi:hypothetical protein